ncbi:MAG: acylneuraminate cytidylyltransferase family protein [Oceanicaulis sp.]|nr:acylneuraminate cytidylyltransferase family protein [Oceanicaulis sp.]
MNILITICARGGSKGIPGKNIKILNGKPLLHYSLELALAFTFKYGGDVQISTDSDEILRCAMELGYATDYLRPAVLATDKAGKIDAIRDCFNFAEKKNKKEYDYIIDLDVTAPLRNMIDLERALEMIQENPVALNIFSVNHANRNPYFNMVEKNETGFVSVVKPNLGFKSRQEAPEVYDMNASFYIYRRRFFTEDWQISTTSFSLAYVMPHICFDLDEPHDFIVMEIMMRENLLCFNL